MSYDKKRLEIHQKLGKNKKISISLQAPKFIFDDNEHERCQRAIEQQLDKNTYNY
jgi:hypothetical protein